MIHYPSGVTDLANAVRATGRRRSRIRAFGSRHSVADAYRPDGESVSLRHLCEIEDLDGDRVRAGGGVVLHDLVRHLDRRGLALPNLGGITAQTVAGFLATGSEGGSLVHSFASSIEAIRLVTGEGEIIDVDREHPWFDAAGVSLGLLGLIIQVTFECVPSYGVEGTETSMDTATALECFEDESRSADYFRVLWYPAVDHCHVWRGFRTARAQGSAGIERFAARTQLLAHAANFVGTRARRLLVRPLLRSFVRATNRKFHGPWYEVLPQDEGLSFRLLPHVYCEVWVPFDRARDALAAIHGHYDRAGLDGMPTLPVELYCAPRNRFWLAPGHGRPSLRINFIRYGLDPRPSNRFFEEPWRALLPFEPRAHWGKYLFDSESGMSLNRNWPRLDDFLALRQELDPAGIYLTPYWERMLGIAPTVMTPSRSRRDVVRQGESP